MEPYKSRAHPPDSRDSANSELAVLIAELGKAWSIDLAVQNFGDDNLIAILDELKKRLDAGHIKDLAETSSVGLPQLAQGIADLNCFLVRLKEDPLNGPTTRDGESRALLKAAVGELFERTLLDLGSLEFSAPATSDLLIAQVFPQSDNGARGVDGASGGGSGRRRRQGGRSTRKIVGAESRADGGQGDTTGSVLQENVLNRLTLKGSERWAQSVPGDLTDFFNSQSLDPTWLKIIERQLLPVRPVVYRKGKLLDLHQVYELLTNKGAWTIHGVTQSIGQSADSEQLNEAGIPPNLPSFNFTVEDLKEGIPNIPGFAPEKVKYGEIELTVERSVFGFYRIKDIGDLSSSSPVSVSYYLVRDDLIEGINSLKPEELMDFFWRLSAAFPADMVPLPDEVRDEITNPGKNADWETRLTRLIIALNMGKREMPSANSAVGEYLAHHMAGRRIGTSYDMSILVSDMLSQINQPNFMTLGLSLEQRMRRVEVSVWNPSDGQFLRVDPEAYSSDLSFMRHRDTRLKYEGPDTAYKYGLVLRRRFKTSCKIPHEAPTLPYREHLRVSSHEYGLLEYADRVQAEVLWHPGTSPLRAEVRRAIRRLEQFGRCDKLIALYLSRREEINDKIEFRGQSDPPIEEGPADLCVELLRTAFLDNGVGVKDLAQFAKRPLSRADIPRSGWPNSTCVSLLDLSDRELAVLGTSRGKIYALLRQSPSVICKIFEKYKFIPEENKDERYLSRANVTTELRNAHVFLDILTLESFVEGCWKTENSLHRVEDLCFKLIQIHLLAAKLQDTELKERARLGFQAVGRAYGKHLPPMADLYIFERLGLSCLIDIDNGFFFEVLISFYVEPFKACLVGLVTANPIFKRYFIIDNDGAPQITRVGAKRLSKRIRASSLDDPLSSRKEVALLHFLNSQALLPDPVKAYISEDIKRVIIDDWLRNKMGINPPLQKHPISQLRFLWFLGADCEDESLKSIALHILRLIEIGIINESYQEPAAQQIESDRAREIRIDPTGGDSMGVVLAYAIEGECEKVWFSVPTEALMRASRVTGYGGSSGACDLFLALQPQLAYVAHSEGCREHYPKYEWRLVNYQVALRELGLVFPSVASAFFDATKGKIFEKSFLGLGCQEYAVQLASELLEVTLLECHFSGLIDIADLSQVLTRLEGIVEQFARQFFSPAGGPPQFVQQLSDVFLAKSQFFMSRITEVGQFTPHVLATQSTEWIYQFDGLSQFAKKELAYFRYDICNGKPQFISNCERAVRVLLVFYRENFEIKLDEIKKMASELKGEIRRISPLKALGQRHSGEFRGRIPTTDRSAEFDHYQEEQCPSVESVSWRIYAKTDKFYSQRFTSGQEKSVLIVFNIGSTRKLADNGAPTRTLMNLIRALNDGGHITDSTRFAVHSHGIRIAYFSVRELLNGPLPILELNEQCKDLTSVTERLIAVLVAANALTWDFGLKLMRKSTSLFQHSSGVGVYRGQNIVLVSETDSLAADMRSIDRTIPDTRSIKLFVCNDSTGEITANSFNKGH